MNKYKIFFYHPEDNKIFNIIILRYSFMDVFIKEISSLAIYKKWICVKCLQTGSYAWRDGKINSKVLQQELATQLFVETSLRS